MPAPQIDAAKYPAKDAKKDLSVTVLPSDAREADPRKPDNCAVSCAARRQHHFTEFVVYRTISYGLREGTTVYERYRNEPGVRAILESYDINNTNRRSTARRIPEEGVKVTFHAPDKKHSLGHLRSQAHKKKQRESAQRRRERGRPAHAYRLPDPLTLAGVRWGPRKRKA